jgi:deoxyadenosine/deoxycytidine kinase
MDIHEIKERNAYYEKLISETKNKYEVSVLKDFQEWYNSMSPRPALDILDCDIKNFLNRGTIRNNV